MPATTDNPTADLESEINKTHSENPEGKAVANPSAESALDEALRAEGFNPDGSAHETQPDDLQKKDDQTPPKKDGEAAKEDEPPKKDDEAPKKDDEAPKDDLDTIELPPHTKPKTAEAWATLKLKAKERIANIEKERDELKTKIADLETKAKAGMSPEEKKEFEELKSFRRKMDVESDPVFKDFDRRVENNIESIYSKLSANGFPKETIEKIKEMGGPSKINWDGLAANNKITSTVKRYIEGKLFENEDLTEKKSAAVTEAKKNADEYLKGRETAMAKHEDELVQSTNKTWSEELLPKMEWLRIQKVDDKMKPEEKALAEAHNKLVESVNNDVKDAVQDNSPRMKALLIAGYANSLKMRWEFDRLKTGTDTKIKDLEKKLADAQGMLDRIKKASPGRVNSSAPATNPPSRAVSTKVDPSDNLDKLLEEQLKIEAARG